VAAQTDKRFSKVKTTPNWRIAKRHTKKPLIISGFFISADSGFNLTFLALVSPALRRLRHAKRRRATEMLPISTKATYFPRKIQTSRKPSIFTACSGGAGSTRGT
jgi:hypothetical protein